MRAPLAQPAVGSTAARAPADLSPTVAMIEAARARLGDLVVETPVWRWRDRFIDAAVGAETEVLVKLELFQRAGSFKPRGALTTMLDQEEAVRLRGVVAATAGNHGLAVSYAAHAIGASAKVVMPKFASPVRRDGCRSYGAEVLLAEDMHDAFTRAARVRDEEGRLFIHPFEGPLIALGTATLGLELARQIPALDAVVIPIGGGGLAGGMAAALKLVQPRCQVFGAEPVGADAIYRSLEAGKPLAIGEIHTICDSLSAPHAEPYSLAMCQRWLDGVVLVDDDAIRAAMALMFYGLKLAVEPAAAIATAALAGPLRSRLAGKRVAVLACGANTDPETLHRHLSHPSAQIAALGALSGPPGQT